jgi:hypothetical protein
VANGGNNPSMGKAGNNGGSKGKTLKNDTNSDGNKGTKKKGCC